MNPQDFIDFVNKECKRSIRNEFNLIPTENQHNFKCYTITGNSLAINRFDFPQESVKVLNWFGNFWLFLEIKFTAEQKKINNKTELQTNIGVSLSVFQGEDSDTEKYQLFRAEWDDYNNPEEKHAQPHWHITSNQAIERTFLKYSDTFEKQDFIELLESEKQKVFDVKRIHFAMNGGWQLQENHIHKINEKQQIVNWLLGLLAHLRTELM